MSARIAYVNGAYVPITAAGVSIEDRGFQFADAIYEVWGVRGGRMLDLIPHFARLARSLREISIPAPMNDGALNIVLNEPIRRNKVTHGLVYLQISRGVAARDHAFPIPARTPTLVITAKNLSRATLDKRGREGVKVATVSETRWARCDIKSVGLLANVLARQKAAEDGALEAWFVDEDGFVTEGAASTAWIVDAEGRLRTTPLSNRILAGVTRRRVIDLARERQIPIVEESFTLADVARAREAFLSSATNGPVPIVSVDGKPVGAGEPGPVARQLRDAYFGA